MSSGHDPKSSNDSDKREGSVSPTESTLPTMRQSGTFEGFGNAKQQLYVRSDRLATEIQSDFGTATYWSTYKGSDGSSRRGNMRKRETRVVRDSSVDSPPIAGAN